MIIAKNEEKKKKRGELENKDLKEKI